MLDQLKLVQLAGTTAGQQIMENSRGCSSRRWKSKSWSSRNLCRTSLWRLADLMGCCLPRTLQQQRLDSGPCSRLGDGWSATLAEVRPESLWQVH